MISPMVKYRIKQRAKEQRIAIPTNYKTILKKYRKFVETQGYRSCFSWASDCGSNILQASAMIPSVILFNAEWAARIVLCDNPDTVQAFQGTIGHELTHKESDFAVLRYHEIKREFVFKVNEIHADFGSAAKMFQFSRQKALEAIRYKAKLNPKFFDDHKHPSWQQRYNYIANYNFNEELICRMAKDINFDDETLVRKISDHFKEIYLN